MLGPVSFLRGSDDHLRKRGVLPEHAKTHPQGTRPDCFLLHGGLYVCRQGGEDTNRQVRRLRFPADKSYLALRQGGTIISPRRPNSPHVQIRTFLSIIKHEKRAVWNSPFCFKWCQLPDSDQPPADYKSAALPDELSWRFHGECYRDRTYDLFRVKEALSR